jgi:hypothetical protein
VNRSQGVVFVVKEADATAESDSKSSEHVHSKVCSIGITVAAGKGHLL